MLKLLLGTFLAAYDNIGLVITHAV